MKAYFDAVILVPTKALVLQTKHRVSGETSDELCPLVIWSEDRHSCNFLLLNQIVFGSSF